MNPYCTSQSTNPSTLKSTKPKKKWRLRIIVNPIWLNPITLTSNPFEILTNILSKLTAMQRVVWLSTVMSNLFINILSNNEWWNVSSLKSLVRTGRTHRFKYNFQISHLLVAPSKLIHLLFIVCYTYIVLVQQNSNIVRSNTSNRNLTFKNSEGSSLTLNRWL